MTGSDADFSAIRATYRLQFHKGFTFRDALALLPYLDELGISHLYASPVMEARPGSTHGYDIVDHNRLNPEIGSEAEFAALVAALHERGMGLVLDFVPNHMGVGGRDNVWWLDVLEWGRESPFAAYFDINWDAPRADLKNRVLLPVLGDQYGVILEKGEIALRFDAAEGSISAWYFDHRFPISPRSYPRVLEEGGPALRRWVDDFAALRKLSGAQVRERSKQLQAGLAECAREASLRDAIAAALEAVNGTPGRPASFRRLHRLLEAQAYRVAYWRVAAEEINYRRFFNINDLAGLRMELPELFEATHRLAFSLIARGEVQGLRIDHIDGLFDPGAYCAALQQRCGGGLYVLVEKILARYESLPDWPIAGSTGYDFVNQVLALFVDPAGESAMTRLYRRLTGREQGFDDVLYACKKRIMQVNLASEMNVLAQQFHRLSISDRRTRDFTLNGMLAALEEVVAAFPVYRTYVSERGSSQDDERYLEWAVAQAKKRWRTADLSILDFVHGVLTASLPGHPRPDEVLRTAMHFQQVTGPVMAKAFEDTAYYRYFRLLALNEVGGDPRRFGISVAAFHHLMQERARSWPHAMVATATHDTKRGEDARLRIALLSELPREWGRRVLRWLRVNRRHRAEIAGELVPDRNVEYLFYQTLVGAWPAGLALDNAAAFKELCGRVAAYMIKAVREGKEESSWSNPNQAYEAALQRFVEGALDGSRPNLFLADFADFIETLARPAAVSSLSQLVLKLTVPGVPDTYQGSELWDFNLVDPDNRRPVDWDRRRALLCHRDDRSHLAALSANWQDGREKLFVARRLLRLRRKYPGLFAAGDYVPLDVGGGSNADRLCAFLRRDRNLAVMVAVPRLVYGLYRDGAAADWGAARIAAPGQQRWRNVFTGRDLPPGEDLRVADLLADFPVAVLVAAGMPETSAGI
ncbi:MAG: malto-oligosyltrehalose synthase [Alphaproteobacteria bacterium]|nr:malto-oligosyltrehalose synthase [Alphaproteobacteria bacterium]